MGDSESYYAREALSDLPDSLFVEHDQPPRLSNPHEVQDFLQRIFPSALKRPGVRGEVMLFIQIDRNGRVSRVVVGRSSGYRAMDRAALRVGRKMEFLPARREGEAVEVWVTQEITFTTRYH